MIIDFSKISPMALHKVLQVIEYELRYNAYDIEEDLKNFYSESESEARNELINWAQEARKITRQIRDFKYPIKD